MNASLDEFVILRGGWSCVCPPGAATHPWADAPNRPQQLTPTSAASLKSQTGINIELFQL